MSSQPRFVALQHRDFRLFWFGRLVSSLGSYMQIIAVNWHIVELLSAAGAAATAFDERARQSLVANIVPLAIFTGGLATVLLTAWIAWRYPRLRNYKLESQQEAVVT